MEQEWPLFEREALERDEKTIVIQVNGKLRNEMIVPAAISTDKAELEKRALAIVEDRLGGKPVRKVIVVPGKLVNVVV